MSSREDVAISEIDRAISEIDRAIGEIDRAIGEIKHATYDHGKIIDGHLQVDAPMDQPRRLHQAAELLTKVHHHDIDCEENDPMTRDLRHRELMHVDQAKAALDRAIDNVHCER